MAIDPSILGELDADVGVAIRQAQQGQQAHLELLRGGLAQDGRGLGSAIGSSFVQASIPQNAMNDKLAAVTPAEGGTLVSAPNVTKLP